MFQPEPMTHLLIAASKEQATSVVTELYRHRVFHITDFVDQGKEGYEGVKIGVPLANASEVSTDMLKIRSIENVFQTSPKTQFNVPVQPADSIRAAIKSELPKIDSEVSQLTAKRSNAETKCRELEQRIAELKPYTLIPIDLDLYRGYDSVTCYAGTVEKDIELDIPNEKYFNASKEGNFIVVFVQKSDVQAVEQSLSDAGFSAAALPDASGSVKATVDSYTEQLAVETATIEDCNCKIEEAKAKYADILAASDEVLSCDAEIAESPLRFATTEEAFVIDGWVPHREIEPLTAALTQATGGNVYVAVDEDEINFDEVPVEYHNPGITKPAEVLVDLYARPKYKELDPTIILGIMFPILFGVIVGDVGYGLIYLIVTLILRKFMLRLGDMGKKIMGVLYGVSFSTIIFGLLYSEFFGLELLWEPVGFFNRHLPIGAEHHPMIMELLLFSVALGIIYISVGRIFGMINHARMDHKGPHRTKAIMANLGWNLMLWGMLLAVFSAINLNEVMANANLRLWIPYIPGTTGTVCLIIAIAVFVIGLVFVLRENIMDIVELPTNLLSHMLSFCRIAAIGLSSVAIATVVNYFASMFFNMAFTEFNALSIVLIVAAVLLIIIGHTVNAVLGVLDGAINSIRLHFVEFFMKFYNGGGLIYKPFGRIRKLSEEK